MAIKSEIRTLLAVVASLALAGCQLVVSFDRDRLDGGDELDAQMDSSMPDGGDGGVMPECGDENVDEGEQCDDGANGDDADGCTDLCEFTCETDAECDDDDGDICNGAGVCDTEMHTCSVSMVELDDGTSCGTADEVCFMGGCITPMCGNGTREPGEACDDGNMVDDDGCTSLCEITCTMDSDCDDGDSCNGVETCDTSMNVCTDPADEPNGTPCSSGGGTVCFRAMCIAPMCGNGTVEPGEDCDDSGESATCNADCSTAMCGDGTVNTMAGETCDDSGESATCDADCTAPMCGDGVVNMTAGEACDDSGVSATCDADCTAAMCGDGTVNMMAGETCDDSGESATCDADCTAVMCGDGTVNTTAGETCDDSGESATCDADCTAAMCGDGVINTTAGEVCDDGNTMDGDGCSSTCAVETGFTCMGEPSTCMM